MAYTQTLILRVKAELSFRQKMAARSNDVDAFLQRHFEKDSRRMDRACMGAGEPLENGNAIGRSRTEHELNHWAKIATS
jgi:hypothetical protein